MKWVKQGLVYVPERRLDWSVTHASLPVVDQRSGDVLRIYFGTRDGEGRSRVGCVDVDAAEPGRVLQVHDQPVFALGARGTFDDNGTTPCCMVNHDRKYLYYVGWNPQVTVSWRHAIGLAVSADDGVTFAKISDGPLWDRTLDEPYFSSAPCVLREGEAWRMWYVSCTGWEMINDHPEPRYLVKYAESGDGVHWRRTGRVCLDYRSADDAIARPCVFRHDGLYKMLYSYRSVRDYRSDPAQSYRLGYAESADGLSWTRRDEEVGITRSEEGWDSEMIAYAAVHRWRDRWYLFYNGDGFGRTGFGYAVAEG